jgi:hypothetical protein
MTFARIPALFAALLFCGCAIEPACDTSVRMNISGTIVTGPMIHMPTMKERGVKSVAFVLKEENQVGYEHLGFTAFSNNRYQISLAQIMQGNPNRTALLERLRNLEGFRYVDVSSFEGEILASLHTSNWDGEWSFVKGSEGVRKRLAELGIDALLVVDENPARGNYVAWNLEHSFDYGQTYALSGMFAAIVIDVKTGREFSHCNYVQASQELVNLTGNIGQAEFQEGDRKVLEEAILRRAQNNAVESLRMLKFMAR